jgi:polysaccharide export outer membrane protein
MMIQPRPTISTPAGGFRSADLLRAGTGWYVFVAAMLATAVFTSSGAETVKTNTLNIATNRITVATNRIAGETNRMNDLDNVYKLAVGDHLSFQIIEDEDDSKEFLITDSGEVDVPYLGHYPVLGKTCKQLALELKAKLEKKYYYQATVIISVNAMLTHGVVYLVGPVRSPGPLELPRTETLTLSRAILRAGGFTDLADQKHVRVTREGTNGVSAQQLFVVNVYDILDQGETDKDLVLKPGDLVYIPERLLRF